MSVIPANPCDFLVFSALENLLFDGHNPYLTCGLPPPPSLSRADEVRSLWAQLRRDEPHLLSNFEEFLARVTYQIKEAHQEKKEMESALQR